MITHFYLSKQKIIIYKLYLNLTLIPKAAKRLDFPNIPFVYMTNILLDFQPSDDNFLVFSFFDIALICRIIAETYGCDWIYFKSRIPLEARKTNEKWMRRLRVNRLRWIVRRLPNKTFRFLFCRSCIWYSFSQFAPSRCLHQHSH